LPIKAAVEAVSVKKVGSLPELWKPVKKLSESACKPLLQQAAPQLLSPAFDPTKQHGKLGVSSYTLPPI
jgi:hypothetical protein